MQRHPAPLKSPIEQIIALLKLFDAETLNKDRKRDTDEKLQLRFALNDLIKKYKHDNTLLITFISEVIPVLLHNTDLCIHTLNLFEQHGYFDSGMEKTIEVLIPVLAKNGLLTRFLNSSLLFSSTSKEFPQAKVKNELESEEQRLAKLLDHSAIFLEAKQEGAVAQESKKAKPEFAMEGEFVTKVQPPEIIFKLLAILSQSASQAYPDAILAKNWVRLLNYYFNSCGITPQQSGFIFKFLRNNPYLPAENYLVELMKDLQLFNARSTTSRRMLIAAFCEAVDTKERDLKWVKHLFHRLYEIGSESTTAESLYDVVGEIIQNIARKTEKNENQIAEFALLAIAEFLADQIRTPNIRNAKQYKNILLLCSQTAKKLIDNFQVNPFNVSLSAKKSFFEMIMDQWKITSDQAIDPLTADLIPHHLFLKGESHAFFQIPQCDQFNTTEERFAYFTLLSELIPLLEDENLFLKHAKQLFLDDLNSEEIIQLRKDLIKGKKLPLPSSPILLKLKDAVTHRLTGSFNKDDQLIVSLLKLLEKQTAVVFQQDQHVGLKQKTTVDLETTEGSSHHSGIAIVAADEKQDRYHLLLNAGSILKMPLIGGTHEAKQSTEDTVTLKLLILELKLFYNDFIHLLSNSKHFANQFDFRKLPEILCRLNASQRMNLLNNLLADNNDVAEKKRSDDSLDPHFIKANKLFQALINPANVPGYFKEKFKEVRAQLLKQTEFNRYDGLFFYVLFRNNINPQFCESFLNPKAAKCIIDHIADPNFLELYHNYEEKPAENALIRLIGIPRHAINLINSDVFKNLNNIRQVIQTMEASNARDMIYTALRNLIIQFDHPKTNVSLFNSIVDQVQNILRRFDKQEDKALYLKQICEVITSKTEIHEKLNTIISALKKTHPLVEDVCEAIDEILHEDKADNLLKFIHILNDRKLTWKLGHDAPSRRILEKILLRIEQYPATDLAAKQIIPALTQSKEEKSRVAFNTTKATNNDVWLQFAWKQKPPLFSVIHQLISADIDASILFAESKEDSERSRPDFIDVFFAELAKQPELLKKPEYFNIFASLLSSHHSYSQLAISKLTQFAYEDEKAKVDKERKAEKPSVFSTMMINIKDMEMLIRIAVEFVKGNRFDLLKLLNLIYFTKTNEELWDQKIIYDSIRNHLGLTQYHYYRLWMGFPGFFTPWNQLIKIRPNSDVLNIALSTENTERYDAEKAQAFFEIFEAINKEKPAIFELIKPEMLKHASKFSLSEMLVVLKSLHALKIPESYPIERFLLEIFDTDPTTWKDKIDQLHSKMRTFVIAGMDTALVKRQFKDAKHSFDHIIKLPKGIFSPIDYFFKVFGEVELFKKNYPIEYKFDPLNKTENLQQLKQVYDKMTPGMYDETQDIQFLGAMTLMSDYTLGKTPYHAQFVTIMGAMYGVIDPKHPRLLVDVATGQGKTIDIGFTAVIAYKLQKVKPEFLPVLTLTPNLSADNAEEMKPFYDAFDISSGSDLNNRKHIIRYGTPRDLLFKKAHDDIHDTEEKTSVIIIDETDVALIDYLSKFICPLGLDLPEFNPILRMIARLVNQNTEYNSLYHSVRNSPEFAKLPEDLKDHFQTFYSQIYDTAVRIKNNRDIPTNASGAITTFENETGIIAANTFGAYGEPQFTQMKMFGVDTPIRNYQLIHHCLYFGDVILQFPIIIGFSGTLGFKLERDALAKLGFRTVDTARFNAKNLTELKPILVDGRPQWEQTMFQTANKYLADDRPVLSFVKKPEDAKQLRATVFTDHKKVNQNRKTNVMVGDEGKEDYRRIVAEATEGGNHTISTIIGGRGVNYISNDTKIDDKGGVVVIIGTPLESYNVDSQVKGRTARRDNKGLVVYVYEKSEVITLLKEAGVRWDDLNEGNLQEKINEMRDNFLKKKFATVDEDKRKNLTAQMAKQFYSEVYKGTEAQKASLYRQFAFFAATTSTSIEEGTQKQSLVEKFEKQFNTRFRAQ